MGSHCRLRRSVLYSTNPARKRAAARANSVSGRHPPALWKCENWRRQKTPLAVNLEIDVGLHRGGMAPGAALGNMLEALVTTPDSINRLYGIRAAFEQNPKAGGLAKPCPQRCHRDLQAARAQLAAYYSPEEITKMTFNMAGSPTFGLYKSTTLATEISAGSALVKPSDFDLPILKAFQPATFIATPALKVTRGIRLPAIEYANNSLGKPKAGTTIFIHGGYWMAQPVFPGGLKNSTLFGRSSNQEMLMGPARTDLAVDDFVFLRPTQSEAVFLQFPNIAVFDGRRITDIWAPLPVSA